MSGTLSAFFGGQTPASVTTPSSTTSNMPDWYQEFIKQNDANAAAAYAMPYVGAQTALGSNASNPNPLVAGMNTGLDQAVDVGNTLGGSGTAATVANQLPGAVSTTLAGYDPNQTMNYLNPNLGALENQISTLNSRTLAETTLPQINDQMIGAGQFGSSRGMAATANAVRDSNLNTQMAQQQLAGTMYGQAQNANLQNLNQLNTNETTAMNLGLKQAGAAEASGQLVQNQDQANINANVNQFNQQQNYPWQQLSNITGIMSGTGAPTGTGSGTQSTTMSTPQFGAAGSPFAGLLTSMNATTTAPTASTNARGGHIKRRRGGLPKRANGGPIHMATGGLGALAPRPASLLPGGAMRPGINPSPGATRFPGGLPRVYRRGGHALPVSDMR